MAESHIVSGLVAKHSELAGLIQFHRAAMERVAADLHHLDATLKLFAPTLDSSASRARKVIHWCWISFGLRQSCLTTSMICTAIMVERGIEDTKEIRTSIQRTLTGTLRRLGQRGLIKEVGRQGLKAFWQIA